MIERYSPPGNLVEDVDGDVDLLQAWSQGVSDLLRPKLDGIQYFDQTAEDHGELFPHRDPHPRARAAPPPPGVAVQEQC